MKTKIIRKNRDQESWDATLAGPNWGLMTLTFQPCLTPPYSLHPSYYLCSPLTLVLLEDSPCYRAVFDAAVTLRVGVPQSAWDTIYIFTNATKNTRPNWNKQNQRSVFMLTPTKELQYLEASGTKTRGSLSIFPQSIHLIKMRSFIIDCVRNSGRW